MAAYLPPAPPRLRQSPPAWRRLLLARKNLLSIWEEEAFEFQFGRARLLLRDAFVCNSPESVQFAFSHENASFERKSPQMRHGLAPLLGDGLFVSDGATWRARRRTVAPIVHVSRLAEFAPVMVETALERCEQWAAREPPRIDALAEMAHLTAEIISRAIFGKELGRNYAHEVVDGFSQYQQAIGQIDLLSLLGLPDWLPRLHRPAVHRAVRRIHAVINEVIACYRSGESSVSSAVIGRLLEARDPETGEPLTEAAVRNEAAVLFMAGHETTANSLAWTWYLLSQCPDVEARLHAELDAVLRGRPPSLADVPQLVYTRAIFEEVLRLYPPVPFLAREAVADATFNGTRIAKGSLLLVVPWLLHRHKKLWDRPDEFVPERFLPDGAGAASEFAYVPFSIGPRVCIGQSFGMTEAILCVATLAQRFRLRLAAGVEIAAVARLTLRPEGGLYMNLERRDAPPAAAAASEPAAAAAVAGCPFHHG